MLRVLLVVNYDRNLLMLLHTVLNRLVCVEIPGLSETLRTARVRTLVRLLTGVDSDVSLEIEID
jgi:hypothetical protein